MEKDKNVNVSLQEEEYQDGIVLRGLGRIMGLGATTKGAILGTTILAIPGFVGGCGVNIQPTRSAIVEPSNSGKQEDTIDSTPEATVEQTVDPVPKPSELTQEEKEQQMIMEEYNKYKEYYDLYSDTYAFVHLKHMVDEGKITPEMLDDIQGPLDMETDEDTWQNLEYIYNDWAAILNGKKEEMHLEALDSVNAILLEESYSGILRVTFLETDEQRERLIAAANVVNEWYKDPSDENRIKMEDAYFSDKLTLGEEEILFQWMQSKMISKGEVLVNGQSYTYGDYIMLNIDRYGTTLGLKHIQARDALFELNNTPNSEKQQSTSSEEVAYNQGYEDGQEVYLETKDYEGNTVALKMH